MLRKALFLALLSCFCFSFEAYADVYSTHAARINGTFGRGQAWPHRQGVRKRPVRKLIGFKRRNLTSRWYAGLKDRPIQRVVRNKLRTNKFQLYGVRHSHHAMRAAYKVRHYSNDRLLSKASGDRSKRLFDKRRKRILPLSRRVR